MSFYVDYNEFRNFKYSVVSQLVSIAQNLENVDVTLSSMIANPAMHGEGAESIYSYLYDMISNTIPIISTIVVDFSSKLSLLEAGLYELEPATYGVLPEEEISATVNAYKMASYDIRVLSEEVNGVINDVSGICEFEKPSVSKLSEHMGAVITRGTVLKQCIEALDESHYNTELAQLEELLDSAIELIDTLNNQSWNVTSYQLGAFCSLPEYTAIADELVDTINYHESNQEELALAEQLCTAKLEDVMADERISEGLNKIFFGADSSSLGFGTLWLARLVAVPWYIKLPAFGIAVLGGFEAVEGAQDVIYGTQGDIHTDSTNALKDLLGEDNYYKAIEYGTLVTGGYMAGKTVYEIAKLKLTGSSAWFGTGVTSDVVPVGAIDDVVPVGAVDDLVSPGMIDDDTIITVDNIINQVENGDITLETNIQKGNYGEMKMDRYYENQGYERISLDRVTDLNAPNHQGIDGVYYNPDGEPPYIIAEAKYGSGRLGTLADGTPQMSDKWIIDRLDNAVDEDIAESIRRQMISNPDNVGSTLVHITPDGEVVVTQLIDGVKQ